MLNRHPKRVIWPKSPKWVVRDVLLQQKSINEGYRRQVQTKLLFRKCAPMVRTYVRQYFEAFLLSKGKIINFSTQKSSTTCYWTQLMTTEHEHLLNVFESRVALIKNTLNSGLTFDLREIKIERMKSYLNLAYLSKDWMVDGRTREREEVKVSKHRRLCQSFNIFQGEYWIVFM